MSAAAYVLSLQEHFLSFLETFLTLNLGSILALLLATKGASSISNNFLYSPLSPRLCETVRVMVRSRLWQQQVSSLHKLGDFGQVPFCLWPSVFAFTKWGVSSTVPLGLA